MKGDILIPDKHGPTDMRGPGVEAAREAGLILPMAWPAGLVLEEFKSCVIYNEQLKLTQMLLENCTTVWHPWRGTAGMGHAVDLGYHAETGKLVAIQIWDDVRVPRSGPRSSPHPDGASPAPFS